jgi:hypothetical protein
MTHQPTQAMRNEQIIAGLQAEQTYIASCRETCDPEYELPRWDRIQAAIDRLAAPTTDTAGEPAASGAARFFVYSSDGGCNELPRTQSAPPRIPQRSPAISTRWETAGARKSQLWCRASSHT